MTLRNTRYDNEAPLSISVMCVSYWPDPLYALHAAEPRPHHRDGLLLEVYVQRKALQES